MVLINSSAGARLLAPISLFRTGVCREAVAELLVEAVDTDISDDRIVCVGDVIDTSNQEGFLRGHGTQVVDGQLVATVCGVVQRVNKLVAVRSMHSRYSAEVGDVVVGRVVEITSKKWRVDLHSKQEASLQLSAVHLPGGVQRRRTAEDELAMRDIFTEGDLISAEVQALFHDGSVALHTRSRRFGKLPPGVLVRVPHGLVERQKQHLASVQELGVDMVLGVNGWIWIGPHNPQFHDLAGPDMLAPSEAEMVPTPQGPPSEAQLLAVAHAASAVSVLASLFFPIHPATLVTVVAIARAHHTAPREMLTSDFLALVVDAEVQRRQQMQ